MTLGTRAAQERLTWDAACDAQDKLKDQKSKSREELRKQMKKFAVDTQMDLETENVALSTRAAEVRTC